MRNSFITFNFRNRKEIFAKINLFLLLFCSFIGVGFVSGAEVYEFFVRFKTGAIFGLTLFFILVSLIIYRLLCISKLNFNNENFDKKSIKNNNLKQNYLIKQNLSVKSKIREFVFTLNVFIVASAMFSGLKCFLNEIFDIGYLKIYIISLIIVFIILLFGVKYLQYFDYIVITFIIFLTGVFIFEFNIDFNNLISNFSLNEASFSMLFSSLYVFMNLFQLKPLIDLSGATFKSKKDCKIFSFLFTVLLSLILIVFIFVLNSNSGVWNNQMPFLELFKNKGGIFKIVFCLGLVISIISTQISALLGFKSKISKLIHFNNFNLTLLTFCCCMIFGLIPFGIFVSILYPLLGVINLLVFVFC